MWRLTGPALNVDGNFGPGLSDFEYKIADDCSLSRYSADVITVDCAAIGTRIGPEAVKLGWNDKYLVAISHPVTKRKYPDNPNNTYTEPDSSVNDDSVVPSHCDVRPFRNAVKS